MIKLELTWVGEAVPIGERGDAYEVLVGKHLGSQMLERARSSWEYSMKTVLKETMKWCEVIHLALDQWTILVNLVENFLLHFHHNIRCITL
jgi:hypothetical protein